MSADNEAPRTTDDLLRQILEENQQHRAEVAQLREELAAAKQPAQQVVAAPPAYLSEEDRLAARMEEINQHDYYCPDCGLLYDYPQRCSGKAESGHPPREVVSTDELKSGDPKNHTPASVYS